MPQYPSTSLLRMVSELTTSIATPLKALLRAMSTSARNHPFLSGSENALRQTSLWMMLATLAPPDSGSFQVKASGIEPFFLAMKSFSASSMLGSRYGAS